MKSVRALARGLDVFKALHSHRSASLHELHSDTGLAKPTLLRILRTLEESGVARRSPHDGRYRVSASVRFFGQNLGAEDAIAEQAAPVLDRLCRDVLWPSDLAVYKDGAMEILESSRHQTPFMVNRDRIGFRVHMLMSAMGRAYLAFSPATERRTILARLTRSGDPYDRSARKLSAVLDDLAKDRARGYAVREAGYGRWGISERSHADAIAVPIMQSKRVVACLSLAWAAGATTREQMVTQHLERLKAAAAEIAAQLPVQRF
ncbi:MAG: IclR family transcriptional regulator C-terminal domain-containing protein [Ferrovibrio sp.]